jgi:hypothetical protein
LDDVTALRTPCRFAEAALTVTPGSASPWLSATCPEMVPLVVCAAAVEAAKIVAAIASHALTGLMNSSLR